MSDCSCNVCRKACETTPGIFHPDQIGELAFNLGTSEQDLFDNHLAASVVHDIWGKPVMYLEPAAARHAAKSVLTKNAHGRCHWLGEDGKCAVHEVGKPLECRHSAHEHSPKQARSFFYSIIGAWDNPVQQAKINSFLGA